MNVNEVIATLASRAARVGRCTPTTTSTPRSRRTTPCRRRSASPLLAELVGHTHPALERWSTPCDRLAARTIDVVKAGRTHLMDATPVTIGQEADAWAGLLRRAPAPLAGRPRRHSASCRSAAPPWARASTCPTGSPPRWSRRSPPRPGCRCARPPTRWSTRAARARSAEASGGLRGVAVALTKVANDIRLLASGPSAGLGELLPARAAGRLVDHAGQGQPGAVRVGEPGGGAGDRQRRHRRLRGVAGHPRAEHVPAGDGRRPAGVGDAARQRRRRVRRAVRRRHRGRRGSAPAATPSARRRWRRRSTR